MERVRRRFWTRAITALAVLVILVASASGLFQIAVQAVPGYRTDIENYVSEITGRPVRIGKLDLTWRYTYPSLDLGQVAMMDGDGKTVLLQAERLRLGFSLRRLLQQNFAPNRLELQGLTLEVDIDPDGRISAPGWPVGSASSGGPGLAPLATFDSLRLERCRLNLTDRRRGPGPARTEPWSFGLAYAELSRGLLRSKLESELILPVSLGESARVSAALQGDWLDLATWSGDWSAEVTSVNAATWLAPWLAPGAELSAEGLTVRVEGELQAGVVKSIDVAVESGPVRASRSPHTARFETLRAAVSATFSGEGWDARLTRFELDGPQGPSPETRIHVAATKAADRTTYEGTAQDIRLSDFAPWMRLLQVPDPLLALDRLSGDVDKLSFRVADVAGELRYQAQLDFRQLALPAGDRAVGAAGLSGELAVDETGGRVLLQPAPARLQLPGLLETGDIAVDELEGEAQWRKVGSDWTVDAPRFRWRAQGTEGQGSLKLELPAESGKSPTIALQASFSSSDVTLAKSLMPRHWGSGLKNWLDRAILAGRVPKGRLKIEGALADFPFTTKPGLWELDLETQDIRLAFHPDWPPIAGIGAQLKFRGNGLAIECTGGDLGGNPISGATARIPEFKASVLSIDGKTRGDVARYFAYLNRSPLRTSLAGLLANRAQGPASVEVHLEVPLKDSTHTHVRGVVSAEGVELQYPGLKESFKDVRGSIAFDGSSAKASDLTARWYGLPLKAEIQPQADGSNLLGTTLAFTLDPAGSGPSELIPAWLRKVVSGDIRWTANLRFGRGSPDRPDGAPLSLSTTLAGVEVRLPPPIGKTKSELVPLEMTVGAAPDGALKITAMYQQRLGADLRLRTRDGATQMQSAALRLGGGPLIEAKGSGISLGGSIEELDARAWYEALDALGLGDSGSTFARAELSAGRVYWNEFAVRDAKYRWQRQAGGSWSLEVGGAGASGELRWNPQRRGRLTAKFSALALEMTEAAEATRPPSDPSRWPVAEFDVEKFRLNQAELGHLQFASERIEDGQSVKLMSLGGGSTKIGGTGEWRRFGKGKAKEQSTGALDFELSTTDIAGVLRALRYAPNLDARHGRIKAQLRWEPSATGLDWRQARGAVQVAFENGQLRAVEPGAGRVLGLVNFYALPRRLTLNFRDVVSSGLGFDSIKGDFALAGGDAITDNLEILGPSLRMETRGRIGLAARDYDQQVTVYPDVSSGVTLGALALGGPVFGVLALIAQEILNKPLDQVTQLSYRLTGSWDNPRVERAETPPEEPGRSRKAPSQK